ncbi:hypothetical protein H0H93_003926 [Arthromyces matolae]|nr:hypothetical protein H0H93_003926 [Arthromyces matolae]
MTPDSTEDDVRDLLWNASSVAGGGFSTRYSMVKAFFLLMSMHPEVQVKAREEIEKVVGTDRFPTFEDRHNLPYINAICREVFRVHTVVPNGPHTFSQRPLNYHFDSHDRTSPQGNGRRRL